MPRLLIVLWMALLASSAYATLDGAKNAYLRGAAKEKAKDYSGAIAEYRNALIEYPAYIYANKQIGNCLYYQGDKAGALAEYDTYLRSKPDDSATRAFAEQIRSELGASVPEPVQGSLPSADDNAPFNGVFYLFAGSGGSSDSGSDWAKLGIATTGGYASNYALGAGYQFPNGVALEAGAKFGPMRRIMLSGGFSSVEFDIDQMGFMIEPLYRFRPGHAFLLAPGLGLGYASVTLSTPSSGATGLPASGSGLFYLPELKLEWLLGPGRQWVLGMDIGYLIADFSPIKGPSGVLPDNSGGNWHIVDSGVYSNVKISFAFGPLFGR